MASANFAIKHPKFPAHANTDFRDTAADGAHRRPVARLETLLNAVQLEAGTHARIVREPAQIGSRRTKTNQRLERHRRNIYLDIYCGKPPDAPASLRASSIKCERSELP